MTNNSEGLIKSEIKGRTVTYYLTTEDDLHSVKSNNLLGDIFSGLASIAIGGIISVILTRTTGIQLAQQTTNILDMLWFVFIIFGVIFSLLTAYFYSQSFIRINSIIGSGSVKSIASPVQEEDIKTSKNINKMPSKESKLEIIKAEYWTQNERLDVTKELRRLIVDNKLDTIASNDIKRDPDKGIRKKLTIEYKFNGITVTKEFTERDKVLIP